MRTHVSMFVSKSVCMYVCARVYVCMCICVYVYVCMCVCMHVHVARKNEKDRMSERERDRKRDGIPPILPSFLVMESESEEMRSQRPYIPLTQTH